jgi:hypothetical protein
MSAPTEPTDVTPPRRHRLRKTLIISGSVVGALIVLGVVLSAVLPPTPATTAASAPTATTSPVSSASRATATRAPAPTTVRTTALPPATTRPVTPPPVTLTGYGATVANWARTHTADSYFAAGSAYDPDSSLPRTAGRTTDKYVAVQPIGGRITDYTVNLPSASLAGAESAIAGEFPPDAHILWTQHVSGCVQVEYASATIHAAIGNTDVGDALVEFSDVVPGVAPSNQPTTFNDASVSDMPGAAPDPSASC